MKIWISDVMFIDWIYVNGFWKLKKIGCIDCFNNIFKYLKILKYFNLEADRFWILITKSWNACVFCVCFHVCVIASMCNLPDTHSCVTSLCGGIWLKQDVVYKYSAISWISVQVPSYFKENNWNLHTFIWHGFYCI